MIIYLSQIQHPWTFLGLTPCIALILHVRRVMTITDPSDFDPELKKVALSTFAFSILTAILLQL